MPGVRDLVVLAMVNQGAEVVADGNIHVYAPLRGKAMAGARGNANGTHFFSVHGARTDLHCRRLPHQRKPVADRCAWQSLRRFA